VSQAAGPASWPHLYVPGSERLVIALHGTGGTEQDGIALARRIAPGAAVLAPRGRVAEGASTRWFRRASEGVFDVDDVVFRAQELADFVASARVRYALGALPATAIGFSNGANMALALGLLHPETVLSVVAFSGMYPFGDRVPELHLDSTSILLLNGDADPLAPRESVDTLASNAGRWGATVDRHTRPGGHGITDAEADSAASWLAKVR
jgi:phospholipase/carboxylesterase